MKERPILFSGPMVRAILAGEKTQTRRLVSGLRWISDTAPGVDPYWWMPDHPRAPDAMKRGGGPFGPHHVHQCPHGRRGDRLWVREGFAPGYFDGGRAAFMADYDRAKIGDVVPRPRFKPGIHMPRTLSRINLEISAVRGERLQDITDDDIRAEGVDVAAALALGALPPVAGDLDLQWAWRSVWDAINGKRAAWASNPWVWVLGFRRLPCAG